MAKLMYEHVFAAGGFSGESFDIAQGPANTGVINVLLSAGDGALTDQAPHVLVSTGALTAPRALDISGMETESANGGSQALKGRFFYLSVLNTNIVTNNITITSSGTINGEASLVIDFEGDYLFHHVAGGVWRVNVLPRTVPDTASLIRLVIASGDWTNNSVKVLATGTPGVGEIGPHGLAAYNSYLVQVINTDQTPDEMVDVELQFAASGDITLRKAPKAPAFNGVVVISGTTD